MCARAPLPCGASLTAGGAHADPAGMRKELEQEVTLHAASSSAAAAASEIKEEIEKMVEAELGEVKESVATLKDQLNNVSKSVTAEGVAREQAAAKAEKAVSETMSKAAKAQQAEVEALVEKAVAPIKKDLDSIKARPRPAPAAPCLRKDNGPPPPPYARSTAALPLCHAPRGSHCYQASGCAGPLCAGNALTRVVVVVSPARRPSSCSCRPSRLRPTPRSALASSPLCAKWVRRTMGHGARGVWFHIHSEGPQDECTGL